MDYSYVPTVQDETYVTGYPWVGSDTISETKGIVSGVSEYNGYKYIKTDTLIASGNSGGAMTNKSGKLIGIPTFTKGGYSDTSLGYALSIADAKDFIQKAMVKTPMRRTDAARINFPGYQMSLDRINTQYRIDDSLFSFDFGSDYEVSNYIPNRYFELSSHKLKEIAINSLRLQLTTTPTLSTESQFLYFAQLVSLYSPDYERLVKVNIGGLTFYHPIYKSDVSGGSTNYSQLFFGQASDRSLVTIRLAASLYDERDHEKLSAEISRILSAFQFHTTYHPPVEAFNIPLPSVVIDSTRDAFMNDRQAVFMQFFGNLHEYATLQLSESDLSSGRDKTVDQIYQIELQDIPSDYKSLVTLHGYRGYIACDDSNDGYRSSAATDENNLPLPTMSHCLLKVFGLKGENGKDYYMTVTLTAEKSHIASTLDALDVLLSDHVHMAPSGTGDAATHLVNIYKNRITLLYRDIDHQTENYKNVLRLLVKYRLLDNTFRLDPYHPMKWGEYIEMYAHMVYGYAPDAHAKACQNSACRLAHTWATIDGQRVSLAQIARDLHVSLDSYVIGPVSPKGIDPLEQFNQALHLRLAGVEGVYTSRDIYYTTILINEHSYDAISQQIKKFDKSVYGKKKIAISDVLNDTDTFTPVRAVEYDPTRGVYTRDVYSTDPISFGSGSTEASTESGSTDTGSSVPLSSSAPAASRVLTRAQAIDLIVPQIDFGLFDPELAKRKDTQISSQ